MSGMIFHAKSNGTTDRCGNTDTPMACTICTLGCLSLIKRNETSCVQEGPSHATKVERQYFPERFGFDLFGDPFEHKRECVACTRSGLLRDRSVLTISVLCFGLRRWEKEQKRKAPPIPNADDIPRGSYTNSCNGCAMDDEGTTRSALQLNICKKQQQTV